MRKIQKKLKQSLLPRSFMMVLQHCPANWYIVQCAARNERRAFESLLSRGFLVWLPEQEVKRRTRRSNAFVTVLCPIFPGYIFVAVDPEKQQDLASIHTCEGVEGIVKFGEDSKVTPFKKEAFLAIVKRIYGNELSDCPFEIGDIVKINAGGFNDVALKVSETDKAKGKLCGHVEMFGQETKVSTKIENAVLA